MDFSPKSTTEEFPNGIVSHDIQFFAGAKASYTLMFVAEGRKSGMRVFVDVDGDRSPVAMSFIGKGAGGFEGQVAEELYEMAKGLVRLDDIRRGAA